MNSLPDEFYLDLKPLSEKLSDVEKAVLLLEGACPGCFRKGFIPQNKATCILCDLLQQFGGTR